MITLTIEQLKGLVEQLENQNKYHDMKAYVEVTAYKQNGKDCISFEQPNGYPDCYSNYYHF